MTFYFHNNKRKQLPTPIVRRLPLAKETWEVMETYHYLLHNEEIITIKKGYRFDGASVPRLFWTLVISPMEIVASALIHDAWYDAELGDRKAGDQLLRETMYLEGASDFQQVCVYWAVRLFGGFCWNRHTPESIAEARKYVKIS